MSTISHAEAHLNDGDQKNAPAGSHPAERFEEGKENSHNTNDKLDQRSIANTLAAEEHKQKQEKQAEEDAKNRKPTDAAKSHGNEPSRGAKIDEQIEKEEQQELENKGRA